MAKHTLNQELWRRVEEIYHEALDHQPESRDAFLSKACNGDGVLRREVETLLAANGSRALLDQPALEIAAELLDVTSRQGDDCLDFDE